LFNKPLIYLTKKSYFVEKMVEIKSPIRLKDLECKLGILFKLLVAGASKKELLVKTLKGKEEKHELKVISK